MVRRLLCSDPGQICVALVRAGRGRETRHCLTFLVRSSRVSPPRKPVLSRIFLVPCDTWTTYSDDCRSFCSAFSIHSLPDTRNMSSTAACNAKTKASEHMPYSLLLPRCRITSHGTALTVEYAIHASICHIWLNYTHPHSHTHSFRCIMYIRTQTHGQRTREQQQHDLRFSSNLCAPSSKSRLTTESPSCGDRSCPASCTRAHRLTHALAHTDA